jgi:hypothetical protein
MFRAIVARQAPIAIELSECEQDAEIVPKLVGRTRTIAELPIYAYGPWARRTIVEVPLYDSLTD